MENMEKTVIKASAGTGKTHNLLGRYREVLGGPADAEKPAAPGPFASCPCTPDEIMAVTFTNKAADELRDRLRSDPWIASQPGAADAIDGSCIGTVDSICLRLLQEYALEAGISPASDQLSAEDAAAVFTDSAVGVLPDYREMVRLYLAFGIANDVEDTDTGEKAAPWLLAARRISQAARSSDISPDRLLEESLPASLKRLRAVLGRKEFQPGGSLEELVEDFRAQRAIQADEASYNRGSKGTAKISDYGLTNISFMRRLMPEAMEWKDWLGLIKHDGGTCRQDLNLFAG
ncbi:MAG: UvrD-helicase domain-containing protein, partial [Mailhella sp.]|nr:UvrD-helicase domain-containing protein [Mailhella sp.]